MVYRSPRSPIEMRRKLLEAIIKKQKFLFDEIWPLVPYKSTSGLRRALNQLVSEKKLDKTLMGYGKAHIYQVIPGDWVDANRNRDSS